MIVQELRLKKGWSQQQLADISGLNVRTIQRIEKGQPASLESYKALGAAFDMDFSELQEASVSEIVNNPERTQIALAFSQVRRVKAFYGSLVSYLLVIVGLATINLWFSPGHLWFLYVAASWGLALTIQGLRAFGLITWFDTDWEIAQVEMRLGRKLSDEELPGPDRRERPTVR